MTALQVDPTRCRYRVLIGTGGIGSGQFFALNGNHTLGREESRSGHFLDHQDYCKLHIIAHYVSTLMGPDFITLPIGKVGDDDLGQRLQVEMEKAGLTLRCVRPEPGAQTLYSLCFLYPDGSGGNLTIDDSACARVDPGFIREAEQDFARFAGEGIALAAPEVPLAARTALLELATQYRFLRAASLTSEEIGRARDLGLLAQVDLLAINIDEAATLVGTPVEQTPAVIVKAAVATLRQIQPAMQISITAGKHGSWTWDTTRLRHLPAYQVKVAGTAGAGDAHFAGILVGLAAGLPLSEAHELATLIATLSITSVHTINKDLNRHSLKILADSLPVPPGSDVSELLGD